MARPVAGVDEAGCAPLAGPVVAAAVILPLDTAAISRLDGLTDSKALSRSRREHLFNVIRAVGSVGVGAASVTEIESLNIRAADMLAMRRAVDRLPVRPAHVLVDGTATPQVPMPVTTLVKGDRTNLSIAAASVIAKVIRDRIMAALARRYPNYGWERNAGYPAPDHYMALLANGITPHHRRTFAPLTRLDDHGRPVFPDCAPLTECGLTLVGLRRDLAALVDSRSHRIVAEFHRRTGLWRGKCRLEDTDPRYACLNELQLSVLTTESLKRVLLTRVG